MKRNFLLFGLVFVLCLIMCSCTSSEDSENYVYPDYPLIEYYFDTNEDWLVVVCENVYGEDRKFFANESEESLNFNKENFVVNTFPAGRGTTAEHMVWLFKNGELLKSVACIDYSFSSDVFEKDFVEMSYEEVSEIVDLKI